MAKKIRLQEGWTIPFLVWGMVFVTAYTLFQADYLPGLDVFMTIGTVAVITGLVLAKSKFSDNTATLFAIVYGGFLIFFLLGQDLPEALTWRERIVELVVRQVTWFRKAFDGGTSRDETIFILQTSLIFWILGYTAAWYTFRKLRIWRVILPSGIVLLSVVYYYFGDEPLGINLGVYFLLALLYVVRTFLATQEQGWRAAAVRYEKDITYTFLRAGFVAALLALIVAWSLPAMSASAAVGDALYGVDRPWRQFQDNWTRLFSSLRSYGSPTNDLYQGSLVLGGPRSVNNSPVMDIYVSEAIPYLYWQSDVLSEYRDGGWDPPERSTVTHFPDEGVLNPPFTLNRQVITQTVVNYIPNAATLYGAPQMVGSDRQMSVDAATTAQGDQLIYSLKSRFLMRPGDIYNVISAISHASIASLRGAGSEYPDWVAETYLQVPDDITPETLALADQLTAPYDNAYDKATAVRDYLRGAISYNDQVAAPPEGVEPIHYTLFVAKEGYCNYYASAMAIMLRSQGIPTRLVRGYAQGELIEDVGAFRIRANNAHTWVEVYFPDYGWIEFEPTASIPLAERSLTDDQNIFSPLPPESFDPSLNADDLLGEEFDEGLLDEGMLPPGDLLGENVGAASLPLLERVSPWQLATAGLLLVIVGGVFITASTINTRVEKDVVRSYGRLGSWGRWVGVLVRPTQTPYERADALTTAVPEGREPIRSLTQQFVLRTFSPRDGDADFDPRREWKALRPLLLRKSVARRLKALGRRRGDNAPADETMEQRFRRWRRR